MHEKRPTDGKTHLVTNAACFGCTIACGRISRDRRDPFQRQEQPEILGRFRRTRIRGGLGAGRGQRRRRSGGPAIRQPALQRARHGPDLLRRHGRRGDGALRSGHPEQGTDRPRRQLRFRRGAVQTGRDDGAWRRLRQGTRPGQRPAVRQVRPARTVDERQESGVPGLRFARHPGHGPGLRHLQSRRLPPARLHRGVGSARHSGQDRSAW